VFNSPANQADHNVFDVSLPIADEMVPFVNYIASLPASQRPKTAAYPMADDPFATPPVRLAQQMLQKLGVKTVYSKIFPEEVADYKAFEQQHYTPKLFIAAAGPDQGSAFISAVGKGSAVEMMAPNGWYSAYANSASQAMVQEYISKYGGNASA
jgi:hypothetical protein